MRMQFNRDGKRCDVMTASILVLGLDRARVRKEAG